MLNLVLKSPKLEFSKAFSHVKDVIDVISNIRENSLTEFKKYFKNASDMATIVGEEIKIPRICVVVKQHNIILIQLIQ